MTREEFDNLPSLKVGSKVICGELEREVYSIMREHYMVGLLQVPWTNGPLEWVDCTCVEILK